MKAAYLGPTGTFTEKAARSIFPHDELTPIQPIRMVFRAVEKGETDYGIVPIENFYNGEVRETLDTLTESESVRIVGEKALVVIHCLGALAQHGIITEILSKDQALEQCSKYICENYPDASLRAVSSTAEAAQIIRREGRLNYAAIASESALKSTGLEVLAKDICPNNKTRFIVLGKEKTKPTGDDKTFLAIHPPIRDRPGVLNDFTAIFASLGINLEYIQSRPDGKKGYYFYVELDGHEEDEKVRLAVEAIKLSLDPNKKHNDTIKVFGSYHNTRWKDDN